MKKREQLVEQRKKLIEKRVIFIEFLNDVFGDKNAKNKINQHVWRIQREIEIIDWCLDEEDNLPF